MTAPTLVTLVLDGAAPGGGPPLPLLTAGYAEFTPNSLLLAPAYQGAGWIPPAPVQVQFRNAGGPPTVELLPTDDVNVSPAGWQWTVAFYGVPGNPAGFSFLLPLTGGATQYLSEIASVSPVTPGQAFIPLPASTPATGNVAAVASVSPLVMQWRAISGTGTVTQVNGVNPDGSGHVTLAAADVGAASTGALTSEATTRASADTALSTAIGNETARAEGAESTLSAAISAETTRAETAEALLIPLTQKGANSGVATLDSGGHIPTGQIPTLNQNTTGTAANLAGGATFPAYVAPKAVTLTDGSSVVIDASAGNVFDWPLGGSSHTLAAPSNPVDGDLIVLRIGYSGSFTPLFNAIYDFNGSPPTWTATSGKEDEAAFRYRAASTKWRYQGSMLGFTS